MASYYYFVTSLPSLRWDSKPLMTREAFLCQCGENLKARDFSLVRSVLEGKKTGNALERKYRSFRDLLKSSLSEERARVLSLQEEKYRRRGERSFVVDNAVHQAVMNANALEAELSLMLLQWNYLESLTWGHYFDVEALLSYALKLSLLERRSLFSREKGNEEFRRLFSNLQYDIKSI